MCVGPHGCHPGAGGWTDNNPGPTDQSPNKLLYTAPINFPRPVLGMDALVRHGAELREFTCEIPVDLPARPLAGLLLSAFATIAGNSVRPDQWLRMPHRRT